MLWTRSPNPLSKNSVSEQPHERRDRLQCSCCGMRVGRAVWRCCSSWLAGGEEQKVGIAIWSSVVVEQHRLGGLHTWSHSAHLLGDEDKQSHSISWQLVSLCRRPLGGTRIPGWDVTHCTRTSGNPEGRGLKRSLAVALPSSCLYTCSGERAKSIKGTKISLQRGYGSSLATRNNSCKLQ